MRLVRKVRSTSKQLWLDESGSTLLEMAICSLLVLTAILGIMAFSLALYADHYVDSAARDGARYAMVRGASWLDVACSTTSTVSCEATSADVRKYVLSTVPPGISSSSLTVTATWPSLSAAGTACDTASGSNSPGCIVQVKVTYPFKLMLPAPSALTIHLSSTSTLAIAQ